MRRCNVPFAFWLMVSGCSSADVHNSTYQAAAPSAAPAAADASALFSAKNAGTNERPFFIADTAHVWPRHDIAVCWKVSGIAFADEQGIVRHAITEFIEKNSQYRFFDWNNCDTAIRARIEITVQDAQAESLVGYQYKQTNFGIAPLPTTMTLNFTFQVWNQPCAASAEFRERCISTIAVHEFLHALGALHEQLSKDLKNEDPNCWKLYSGKPDVYGTSPKPLTKYDPDSIMNYCRPIYAEPTRLSPLDLQGLTALSDLTAQKNGT